MISKITTAALLATNLASGAVIRRQGNTVVTVTDYATVPASSTEPSVTPSQTPDSAIYVTEMEIITVTAPAGSSRQPVPSPGNFITYRPSSRPFSDLTPPTFSTSQSVRSSGSVLSSIPTENPTSGLLIQTSLPVRSSSAGSVSAVMSSAPATSSPTAATSGTPVSTSSQPTSAAAPSSSTVSKTKTFGDGVHSTSYSSAPTPSSAPAPSSMLSRVSTPTSATSSAPTSSAVTSSKPVAPSLVSSVSASDFTYPLGAISSFPSITTAIPFPTNSIISGTPLAPLRPTSNNLPSSVIALPISSQSGAQAPNRHTPPAASFMASPSAVLPQSSTAVVVVPIQQSSTAVIVQPVRPTDFHLAKRQISSAESTLVTKVHEQDPQIERVYKEYAMKMRQLANKELNEVRTLFPSPGVTDVPVDELKAKNSKDWDVPIVDRQENIETLTFKILGSATADDKPTSAPASKKASSTPAPQSSKFTSSSTLTPTSKPISSMTSTALVQPSVLSGGAHCPYPYPSEHCNKPITTLITGTKKLETKTFASSSKKGDRPTVTGWCPYPGQKC